MSSEYKEEFLGYEHPEPCWIWQKSLNEKGYGRKSIKGRNLKAHRVYYEERHGSIEDDLQLDHLCRNRACCNPSHLEPVTHRVNQDRRSKFTWEKAAEVRALAGNLSQEKIAEKFGISRRYVRDILAGRCWNGSAGV